MGESSAVGAAAVSPIRNAGAVSIRGTADCAFCPVTRVGEGGIARSRGLSWVEDNFEEGGDVMSVSAAVEFDMLLDDGCTDGAAYILEAVETYESCESGSSRL
jgi:hypothetical protein